VKPCERCLLTLCLQYKHSLRKLIDTLPQTVLQCEMLFDPLLRPSSTPSAAPSACPVCVLATVRSTTPTAPHSVRPAEVETARKHVALSSVASRGGDGRPLISTVRTVGDPVLQTPKSAAK
jgi:hypothetical protein